MTDWRRGAGRHRASSPSVVAEGRTVLDCAGAGQRVTRQPYRGTDRRARPDLRIERALDAGRSDVLARDLAGLREAVRTLLFAVSAEVRGRRR